MARFHEIHINATGQVAILDLGQDGPYAVYEGNTATEIGYAETLGDAREMVNG